MVKDVAEWVDALQLDFGVGALVVEFDWLREVPFLVEVAELVRYLVLVELLQALLLVQLRLVELHFHVVQRRLLDGLLFFENLVEFVVELVVLHLLKEFLFLRFLLLHFGCLDLAESQQAALLVLFGQVLVGGDAVVLRQRLIVNRFHSLQLL